MKNDRQTYETTRSWESENGFARAVRIGNLVETSLCSPSAPDGTILFPGDVYRQTQACLVLIGESLNALGMDFQDVIKTRIYLANPQHWVESGRAHAEVFKDIRPALGWIYMSAFFNPNIVVEVECTAYRAS
ncbi:MAG: Rid family hydrolase [Limnohabitans sp.]|jgi:enamine deaminase RidA (YjgF/YER057c/UK114 family)|nr:Rid family hydrolase [Burkholderiales bacterium]